MRADAGGRLAFSTDATPEYRALPDLVVFPGATEDVAAVLHVANERRVPVVPRGAGTNLSAGVIPSQGGIVLVLTRMSRLLELDTANLVAVCQPGLRTAALADAAAAEGLLYRPIRAAGRRPRSAATSRRTPAGCAASSTGDARLRDGRRGGPRDRRGHPLGRQAREGTWRRTTCAASCAAARARSPC